MTADSLFFITDFNYSSDMLPSFILRNACLPNAFCALQNTKSKLIFRKIENMQLWHFVSSVAGTRNPLNANNLSCI